MSTEYKNGSYLGLILYRSCPAEYCKTGNDVKILLKDLDSQCDHNRSGVLCGACATNHSLLLGSSQCQVCSNHYLALLIPFALAGIVLVIFLIFLRLTVATGMINGLILYANFVQVNRRLFFPMNTVNILTVFIAWMNLDLGFETCFFAGMDAYAQTWLQFIFPLYIWILISLIILSSRYSITVSRLIGSNPIAVLATLLLMSYAKIFKIIIEVFSSVNLDYPNGRKVTVWLKDANLPYLQSKHLLLTVMTSLAFIFTFLPYTILLLVNSNLYRLPQKLRLHWFIHRIKPLLDAYNAPYKVRARYWTGFLLLVRCVMYIIFSVNSLRNTNLSLLITIIAFSGIGLLAAFGRIYRNVFNEFLDELIYFNLVVLSAGTLAEVDKATLSSTLVGTVLVTMMVVSAYQFHLVYISRSRIWLKMKSKISFRASMPKENELLPAPSAVGDAEKVVTKTNIDLREPLLEN